MREHLAQPRFSGEDARERQGAGDLLQGLVSASDMKAGAEIDDQIEVTIGEGEAPHIGHDQFSACSCLVEPRASIRQQRCINVDTHEASRREVSSERWKGDASPTADLQDAG
jgi:hypothetical protein